MIPERADCDNDDNEYHSNQNIHPYPNDTPYGHVSFMFSGRFLYLLLFFLCSRFITKRHSCRRWHFLLELLLPVRTIIPHCLPANSEKCSSMSSSGIRAFLPF